MRAYRYLAILLFAVILVLPQAVLSSQRVVLLESFTNVSCPPCASSNPITHQFVEDFGTVLVLNVQYHMSWPSATDPFYLTDIADNDAARAYYGVNAVPDLVTDGLNEPAPGNYAALEATVQKRILTDAPLEILVSATVVGDQITVDADITAVNDVPASDLVVRIALVEPYVGYVEPPGSNGETEFHCSMRDMLPAFAGTALSITNGQTVSVSETGTLDPAWQDVYAVVWVQNNADKDVLQTASTLVRPDYAMCYGGLKGGDIVPLLTMASFHTVLSNVGSQSDIYDLHLQKDLPTSWAASVCIGTTCYPPFLTDFEVPLASLTQQEVIIDITPLENMGCGTVTMTATSRSDPTQTWSKTVMVMTAGDDVLLVDDDSGEAWETYYAQAIGATDKSHAIWDASTFGPPNGDQLGHYDTVVWSSGFGPPTGDAVTGLTSYLDAGGSLLLSGQLEVIIPLRAGLRSRGRISITITSAQTSSTTSFKRSRSRGLRTIVSAEAWRSPSAVVTAPTTRNTRKAWRPTATAFCAWSSVTTRAARPSIWTTESSKRSFCLSVSRGSPPRRTGNCS